MAHTHTPHTDLHFEYARSNDRIEHTIFLHFSHSFFYYSVERMSPIFYSGAYTRTFFPLHSTLILFSILIFKVSNSVETFCIALHAHSPERAIFHALLTTEHYIVLQPKGEFHSIKNTHTFSEFIRQQLMHFSGEHNWLTNCFNFHKFTDINFRLQHILQTLTAMWHLHLVILVYILCSLLLLYLKSFFMFEASVLSILSDTIRLLN